MSSGKITTYYREDSDFEKLIDKIGEDNKNIVEDENKNIVEENDMFTINCGLDFTKLNDDEEINIRNKFISVYEELHIKYPKWHIEVPRFETLSLDKIHRIFTKQTKTILTYENKTKNKLFSLYEELQEKYPKWRIEIPDFETLTNDEIYDHYTIQIILIDRYENKYKELYENLIENYPKWNIKVPIFETLSLDEIHDQYTKHVELICSYQTAMELKAYFLTMICAIEYDNFIVKKNSLFDGYVQYQLKNLNEYDKYFIDLNLNNKPEIITLFKKLYDSIELNNDNYMFKIHNYVKNIDCKNIDNLVHHIDHKFEYKENDNFTIKNDNTKVELSLNRDEDYEFYFTSHDMHRLYKLICNKKNSMDDIKDLILKSYNEDEDNICDDNEDKIWDDNELKLKDNFYMVTFVISFHVIYMLICLYPYFKN